jgi:CHAD domain-containing protein
VGDGARVQERELKLDVPEGFAIPQFDAWEPVSDDEVVLSATYWDTTDLRLLAWGHTLRRRTASDGSEDGWTLKLAHPPTGQVAVRDEIDAPPDTDHPPSALVDAVRGIIRHEPLRPVATIETRRRRRRFRDPATQTVVEVADDRVTSTVDEQPGPSFRQLEVELLAGDDGGIERACRVLRTSGATAADPTPKLARVLADRLPAPPLPDVALGPDATIGDLVRAAFAGAARRLLTHDPYVRVSDDPEAVHQARVATRRLRSDLKTLGQFLDEFRTDGLRRELGWLGGAFGAVRDLDVLAEHLRHDAETLTEEDAAPAPKLLERLAEQRHAAALELRDAMASSRYLVLVEDLHRFAERPPHRHDANPARPAAPVARTLVRRAYRRVTTAVQHLDGDPPDAALHEIRKRAKRARYAAELVAPLTPRAVGVLADRLARLQDALGELQDAVVAEAWLRSLRSRHVSVPEAFAAGQLAQLQTAARARARANWPKAWRRAHARKLRAAVG